MPRLAIMTQKRHQTTTIISAEGRPVKLRVREIVLEVVGGPDTGARCALTKRRLSVGSHPSNDLVLADPTASRFHFRIVADDLGYRLLDDSSTNGTFVNGIRVRDGYLPDGSRIESGGSALTVSYSRDETEIELLEEERFGDAVGQTLVMREVLADARRAAGTQTTVLLLGETGTGKDVLARAIHGHSPRAGGAFVVFDCGAVAESLVESELFGHVKGAFTGAEVNRAGVFQRARGGTVFLDEIGELPLGLQPKLLRAIENRVITPVGGTEEIEVDVRIIAATHRDLQAMVEDDRFRSDLYYRLAIVPIAIPPLRDRREDIPVIAGRLFEKILPADDALLSSMRPHFDETFATLRDYPWPGNVRELRNVIERAAALANPAELAKDGLARLLELRSSIARTLGSRPPLSRAREQFDREYLRDTLAAADGDIRRAAEIAHVHPKSFERLLRRYRISRT